MCNYILHYLDHTDLIEIEDYKQSCCFLKERGDLQVQDKEHAIVINVLKLKRREREKEGEKSWTQVSQYAILKLLGRQYAVEVCHKLRLQNKQQTQSLVWQKPARYVPEQCRFSRA